jgi:hypothetical protein
MRACATDNFSSRRAAASAALLFLGDVPGNLIMRPAHPAASAHCSDPSLSSTKQITITRSHPLQFLIGHKTHSRDNASAWKLTAYHFLIGTEMRFFRFLPISTDATPANANPSAGISNRQTPTYEKLETNLTHTKQRFGPLSNRQCFAFFVFGRVVHA